MQKINTFLWFDASLTARIDIAALERAQAAP